MCLVLKAEKEVPFYVWGRRVFKIGIPNIPWLFCPCLRPEKMSISVLYE